MYKDRRYDNSATANCRRCFCGCLEQEPAGRFRRGPRYRHKKAAVFVLAAVAIFLWYHTGTDTHATTLRGGGLGGGILIVGGFGYIGAAIAEIAMDQDYKVFVVDSSAAYGSAQLRDSLITYIDSDQVSQNSRGEPLADAMRRIPNGVDHVVYAAGIEDNGEKHSIWDSSDGVRSVIEWSRENSVQSFILLSSMEVCHLSAEEPDTRQSPKVEGCTAPAEDLLKHKRAAVLTKPARKALETEMIVDNFCGESIRLRCAVLRLSVPYGPGIRDGPIASVMDKVKAGQVVDVPEMDVPRDYIHSSDIALALTKTISRGLSKQSVLRMGICSGVTTSVETWARTAIETSKSSEATLRLPSQRDNGPGITCDVHRAWRAISFHAEVGVDEGIMTLLPQDDEPQGFAGAGM